MNELKKESLKAILLTCLLIMACVLLFLLLDHTQAFVYYYREQHQIFLLEQDYTLSLLKQVGGFALLVSQWLVQFFVLPHMGAFISTMLCFISAVFFFLACRHFVKISGWLLPLMLLPSFFICLGMRDVLVPYEGLVSLVLIAIFLWLFSLLWQTRWLLRITGGLAFALLCYYLIGPISIALPKKINPAFDTLLQQIHYADTEEWDKLLAVEGVSATNDVQMNYVNLALSHQGRLLDQLFAYPQQSIGSLIIKEANFTDMSVLMSRIYYQIGAIGAAQNQAFSSTVGITYGNPSMTKLLIKTYLINGYYALAEKHIKQLEKTLFYSDWASSQRQFLYNDTAVEADAELVYKRRCLAQDDRFTMLYGPVEDLLYQVQHHPENQEARDYLVGMFMMAKDLGSLRLVIPSVESGTQLPLRLQEAMTLIYEREPEYCLSQGVSEETMQHFMEFKRAVATLRSQGRNVKALEPQYGKTFWYHFIR
ncbi:MAG: DUF6057 family protein [Bacteroidaceae bacterium]|nr:DUF6057 family protein [Bacteroidaceae bacterium]